MISRTSIEHAIATMAVATGEFRIRVWDMENQNNHLVHQNADISDLDLISALVDRLNGVIASCDFEISEVLFYINQ